MERVCNGYGAALLSQECRFIKVQKNTRTAALDGAKNAVRVQGSRRVRETGMSARRPELVTWAGRVPPGPAPVRWEHQAVVMGSVRP
jgi:hypothetical protein